ncbi:hypothetical protein HG263_05370 [Pseudoalteromonas sp. JBTF-M23]|uniref:Uncharacterized protein n=1 Tax=Pseudoalteromonas caenipelagi TaxID=2726988 RepID=A0A849VAJ2_9GAMM|nr:hypothetical protein [Pseudoalteromonas caenipelagi]NOU49965.1 hypothetical protein [Pseudoalteromonas caenipelagi]
MSLVFHRVTEGEFVRLFETGVMRKFIAQQSSQRNKYHLIGIAPETRTAYTIRHGRVDELRTWRLDNLGQWLAAKKVTSWEVQNKPS